MWILQRHRHQRLHRDSRVGPECGELSQRGRCQAPNLGGGHAKKTDEFRHTRGVHGTPQIQSALHELMVKSSIH
jgi:hypothetical protein